jgi:hypothetical protein
LIANSLKPPQEVSARCEVQCEKIKELFKLEVVKKKDDKKTGENMFKQKLVFTTENRRKHVCSQQKTCLNES